VVAVIQVVAIERRLQPGYIGLGLGALGPVGRAAQVLHDDSRQQPKDQYDDHDLDEGEALLELAPAYRRNHRHTSSRRHRINWFNWNIGSRIANMTKRITPAIASVISGSRSAVSWLSERSTSRS